MESVCCCTGTPWGTVPSLLPREVCFICCVGGHHYAIDSFSVSDSLKACLGMVPHHLQGH